MKISRVTEMTYRETEHIVHKHPPLNRGVLHPIDKQGKQSQGSRVLFLVASFSSAAQQLKQLSHLCQTTHMVTKSHSRGSAQELRADSCRCVQLHSIR